MSSTYYTFDAGNLINGVTDTSCNPRHPGCPGSTGSWEHPLSETDPFAQLDLGALSDIGYIVFDARSTFGTDATITGPYEVWLSDTATWTSSGSRCNLGDFPSSGTSLTIDCVGTAQYVTFIAAIT